MKPVVFEVEAFDPVQCPNDDIWPCAGPGGGPNKGAGKRIRWDQLA